MTVAQRVSGPPRAFVRRMAASPIARADPALVTEADMAVLPAVVGRYLRAMGVVGAPRTGTLRAHLTGRFRSGPGRPWMPMDAWQYNSAVPLTRLFRMRVLLGGLVPMWGWDTYQDGRGRMLGKALNLVTVADGSGPEFDAGELVTWLNDAVLMAPSMLLTTRTTWAAVSRDAFRVTVSDAGRTVAADVVLDDRGLPLDFRTDDRWADLPGGPVRTTWSTPVHGWVLADGRPRLVGGSAVWHLPDGPFLYAELMLARFDRNVRDQP